MEEAVRKEIIGAADPTFIHHAQYTKELPTKNKTGTRYAETKMVRVGNNRHVEVVFKTDSAEIELTANTYEQQVILLDLMPSIRNKKNKKKLRQKVLDAINNGDLLVTCDCNADLYWGYKYIRTKNGVAHPKDKEMRAPDIRNPQERGIICKHQDLMLHAFPFNASKITADVEKILPKRLKPKQ